MQEENFGPLLAVWPVRSDDEATALVNGTRFGLTASVWTRSRGRAAALAARLNVGTVFANRCDYVDPYLQWGGGWGLSGLGSGVGAEGFMAVTRAKATHFKFVAAAGEKE
jgi:acyl-CoA reductase-like NAD-dependent aldehyde dehydrogenase